MQPFLQRKRAAFRRPSDFVWLFLLLLLPAWGCSAGLQQKATVSLAKQLPVPANLSPAPSIPTEPSNKPSQEFTAPTELTEGQNTPPAKTTCGEEQNGKVADLRDLASLQNDDALDQGITGELDPSNVEEIPLPGPNDFGSLDSETANTDDIEDLTEVSEPDIHYDFPITLNEQVEFFLDQYQNSQREIFGHWLARSGRYLPMIQKKLAEAGLPEDLCYLPMIESGFRLTAYSRARAVGPWQFMRGTGRRYGLTINNYVDERRDPIKSTGAAIHYLSDLYAEFQSWPLAVAAYNAGDGRVRMAINKTGSTNFWTLAKSRYLKKETKYYVPKLIAAIIIAKNPAAYGFEKIEYEEPLTFETVQVPKWTNLRAVALAANIPFEELYDLNRHLRRTITPPNRKLCRLRVPIGTKKRIKRYLPHVLATVTTKYKSHVVRRGETLTRICRRYAISKKNLLKANNLRTAYLKSGERLRIPYRTTSYKLLKENVTIARIGAADMAPENLVRHKVLPGESVSELAHRYNVPPTMIAAWNGLDNLNRIKAGQVLSLYLKNKGVHSYSSGVHSGDRLASSSMGKREDGENNDHKTHLTYYLVKDGDTLWTISQKFETTPDKIRHWNGIDGNLIHPGRKLMLKVATDLDA